MLQFADFILKWHHVLSLCLNGMVPWICFGYFGATSPCLQKWPRFLHPFQSALSVWSPTDAWCISDFWCFSTGRKWIGLKLKSGCWLSDLPPYWTDSPLSKWRHDDISCHEAWSMCPAIPLRDAPDFPKPQGRMAVFLSQPEGINLHHHTYPITFWPAKYLFLLSHLFKALVDPSRLTVSWLGVVWSILRVDEPKEIIQVTPQDMSVLQQVSHFLDQFQYSSVCSVSKHQSLSNHLLTWSNFDHKSAPSNLNQDQFQNEFST